MLKYIGLEVYTPLLQIINMSIRVMLEPFMLKYIGLEVYTPLLEMINMSIRVMLEPFMLKLYNEIFELFSIIQNKTFNANNLAKR